MDPRRRVAIVAALVAIGVAGPGCGDDAMDPPSPAAVPGGENGTLVYALASDPRQLDPLLAGSRSEMIVTRQVHEPLVEELRGPFGDVRELPGLAKAFRASRDGEIWSFRLRERVRFQDGTPFNASAVLVNAERWLSLPAGRQLLPSLAAVDAPRPDLVRFILDRPDPGLPRRLSSPRLGIVSPQALRPRSGVRSTLERPDRSGTGAFEYRGRQAGRVVMARNVGWWGTRRELGPALDQISFAAEPDESERLALLIDGTAQVADQLGRESVATLRRDPLLTFVDGPGTAIGLERSVRGIDSTRPGVSLSGVWLTTVGAG